MMIILSQHNLFWSGGGQNFGPSIPTRMFSTETENESNSAHMSSSPLHFCPILLPLLIIILLLLIIIVFHSLLWTISMRISMCAKTLKQCMWIVQCYCDVHVKQNLIQNSKNENFKFSADNLSQHCKLEIKSTSVTCKPFVCSSCSP